ncbi:SH3 domain-binding protein 5-like isoform X2 [Onthophagus taurus]|uniref:SH3 domain-binding protein 5-like isoform X2 n=1 Tax=Onthophagus taurus TaxID=166361 RepID=UPI000C2036DE|nr:SH3 domain-binding protein 5-like isoform X2 [Onthophagus taurus]
MSENGAEYTDSVDPRVHIELERLNSATDNINRLEVDLDDARASFRQLLCESTAKVEALRVKLGLCVERAKPYYEARFSANEALKHTQIAAMKYERANSAHSAAREMVYLAEQGLGGRTLDPAWQEMLNHATQRVNDAEKERCTAGTAHRIACVKLEASNTKVQSLQKDLKRAISKSRPYYEMKAHFNNLLEQQKYKVQHLESQVSTSKLIYADALRNLEQISDEIHQKRNKENGIELSANKQISVESSESFIDEIDEEEYKSLPRNLTAVSSPIYANLEELEGYKNISVGNSISPMSPISQSEESEKVQKPLEHSQSNEWTEINLDVSSPEEDIPYKQLDGVDEKPKLSRQKTLPNPSIENEYSLLRSKVKLDGTISNWISRSSAKSEAEHSNVTRRQSLDNILGPTGEKVKEIFNHGMMMLNISSLTERRNSEPKPGITEDRGKSSGKKLPSPLEKTLTYLNIEDDNSDTESLSSVDMLNEEQINSLMLDKEIGHVCEQLLGTPLIEVVSLPQCNVESSQPK